MIREIYVVGDESRLVVKKIFREFRKTETVIHSIKPIVDRLSFMPDKRVHVVLCLSEDVNFAVVRRLAEFQSQGLVYLYIIGSMPMSIEEGDFLRKVPSVRFSTYSVDIPKLMDLMENNEIAKKRILVVDDEPILLRSIKEWLGDEYEVSVVNSGESALEFLVKHTADLILLDYKMPSMDGPEVLKRIRSNPFMKKMPVIFLTANNSKEDILSVVNLKPDGYILKTESPDELKNSVREFFKNRVVVY